MSKKLLVFVIGIFLSVAFAGLFITAPQEKPQRNCDFSETELSTLAQFSRWGFPYDDQHYGKYFFAHLAGRGFLTVFADGRIYIQDKKYFCNYGGV